MTAPAADSHSYDVIIVGLGPTGAALANLLGLQGISVLALEREAALYPLPRAVHMDDETMRIFQTIGIADDLSKQLFVNRGMRFIDKHGNILLDWPRPQEVTSNGWHASYRCHQPDLEAMLREALRRFLHVEMKTAAAVTGFVDDGEGVTVRYVDADGAEQSGRAQYLVGCDGARSMVRTALGIDMPDLGFCQQWLVVDVLLKAPKPELGDYTLQYCNPERPATYCRNVGSRRRWEFALFDNEDPDSMQRDDTVRQLLEPWLTPDEADIERKAVYQFRSAVAEVWRVGRVLLAGDAVHLTPPFMGQGMCAGIRDACNLAWKLARCCRAHDEALLESYPSERAPHVRQYIETASRMGELVNRIGSAEVADTAAAQTDGSVKMASLAPKLGPGLGDAHDSHCAMLFPQIMLADGVRLDDWCGFEMLWVLSDDVPQGVIGEGVRVLTPRQAPELRAILRKMGVCAVLVRPDRYVLTTAAAPEDIPAVLRQFFLLLACC